MLITNYLLVSTQTPPTNGSDKPSLLIPLKRTGWRLGKVYKRVHTYLCVQDWLLAYLVSGSQAMANVEGVQLVVARVAGYSRVSAALSVHRNSQ
jgi:hypothetical protein